MKQQKASENTSNLEKKWKKIKVGVIAVLYLKIHYRIIVIY